MVRDTSMAKALSGMCRWDPCFGRKTRIILHTNQNMRSAIIGQLPKDFKFMAPATLKFPDNAGYGMMTEADLINYSDLSLQAAGCKRHQGFLSQQSRRLEQLGRNYFAVARHRAGRRSEYFGEQ